MMIANDPQAQRIYNDALELRCYWRIPIDSVSVAIEEVYGKTPLHEHIMDEVRKVRPPQPVW